MARIVVPLDESSLAEHALPWAAELARALQLAVHLVAVYDYDDESWERLGIDTSAGPAGIADALERYLADAAARPPFQGLTYTTEVRLGNAAEQINDAASEGDTRFVVLASKGEGGLKRFSRGSVADALVRHGSTPVLIVRPPESGERTARFARLLVPLDGSEVSEIGLAPAREVAAAAHGEVHLLRIVNPIAETAWVGVGPAPDMGMVTEQLSESARAYLASTAQAGEHTDVLYGRPLDAILEYVQEHDCDVIVMGSHGRGGVVRLALGSTTDAVMRASDRPVLVIPHRAVED